MRVDPWISHDSMAAGKTLWVKLRYHRIRPSSASGPLSAWTVTGQGSDPTSALETASDIRTSLTSPLFDDTLDNTFDPQPDLTMSTVSSSVASSIEIPHPISGPTPSMVAEILSQRKGRKNNPAPKRSMSTGHVASHPNGDSSATLAEKRRNKLGYHRTSIACSRSALVLEMIITEFLHLGHCRRRKIRCLAAPDDPHNRCANCIRLKKECNFFPVDQQPPIERRSRNLHKGAKRLSHSTESSPAMFGPHGMDHHDPLNPFQNPPLTTQGFHPSAPAFASGMISPGTRGGYAPSRQFPEQATNLTIGSVDHTRPFDFNQPPQLQQQPPWHSSFHEPSPMSAGHSSPGEMSSSYWGTRHSDSPLTPAYSPHLSAPKPTMNGMDARNSVTSFAHPATRNDSTWSAPARSTSMGMVEDFVPNYPKHHSYPQPLSLNFTRRQSDMHPPSLVTSASSHASMSEANMTPLSAPVSSPPDTWGVGSSWGTLPSSAVTKPTDFGWYGEPTLANVQEEDVPPHFGEQPAIVYADGDPR